MARDSSVPLLPRPGAVELALYEGAGTGSANRSKHMPNERGSIAALVNVQRRQPRDQDAMTNTASPPRQFRM